jgi:hypothetical protein
MKESVIIPDHKFISWKGFLTDGGWQITAQKGAKENDPGFVQVSSRRWTFTTRQIEGVYPNWRHVTKDPGNAKSVIQLNDEAAEAILQIVPKMPCHDKVNLTIGIKTESGKLILRGINKDDKEWTEIEVKGAAVSKNPVTVYLNRDFLTKALEFGLHEIHITDALTPLRFVNRGRQMIVMPVRVESKPEPTPEPQPPPQPQPATPSNDEAAGTPTERKPTMPRTAAPTNGTTNGNGSHRNGTETKSGIESALDQIEGIKGSYRQAIQGLNELADTLKQVQRDQKASNKEVQSVRTTLEKLQSVKL